MPGRVCSLWLLLAAATLAGCGQAHDPVVSEQRSVAERGARRIRADLEALLARARRAALEGPDLASQSRTGRFDALERLRAVTGVDGLLWEDPGGESAWAGRVVEPRPAPGPGPWAGSLRRADVALHMGPALGALVVGPTPSSSGYLNVTLLLDEREVPDQGPAFRSRWLEPLGLAEAHLEAPDAPARAGEDPAWAVEHVSEAGAHAPLLRVSVRAPGREATADRLAARHERRAGLGLLALLALGLLGGVLGLRRYARAGWPRAAAGAGLLLLTRAALASIDLPRRFPSLAEGFAPTDFGVEDPLGWLASPGDLALTALALLGVIALLVPHRLRVQAPGGAPRPVAVALGAGLMVGAVWLWLRGVALAVTQGHTPFFQSTSFVPPWPTTLMLAALVALTASAALLAACGARLAEEGLPTVPRPATRLLVAALATALAWLALGARHPVWAVALLPLVTALTPRPREPAPERASAGRVLLLGVLATALLFPLLWAHVAERRREDLAALLDRLAGHSAQARSDARLDLAALAREPRLSEALLSARSGPRPEGLALSLWLQSSLARPGAQGVLAVLDEHGRLLDEFSLDATPRKRLPSAIPPTTSEDLQVQALKGDVGSLGAVVGRVRVRAAEAGGGGEAPVLGHLVLTIPDPADLLLSGAPLGAVALSGEDALPAGRRPIEVALLAQGRVVASSAPQISREPGGFGPLALGALAPGGPELSWDDGLTEGIAVFQPERGAVLALRRRATDLGDLVLALSRLVVVGVGLALLLALAVFFATVRGFRVRLHHRILVSYFLISVIPLVLLAWASAGETRARHDEGFSERLEADVARARGELEAQGAQVFDVSTDEAFRRAAWERRHDAILYRAGRVSASSRAGLFEAEVRPTRLPAEAYRATVLERRATVKRELSQDGRAVWTGYAPVLGPDGYALATLAVPLLYDKDRIDEELTVTGSVVLAGYLLTLVLVLALGIYAARWLARPLDELARGTAKVARGDLSVVLPGEGHDELGQLVASFNAMTRDLKEATDQAARAEREAAWRRMARQVAHEIKNPLSPMKLMVQQLEADVRRDPARASEAIQRTAAVLLRQIDALARIAGTFGELARLPPRSLAPVDVAALVRHVVDLNAGSRAHGVEVLADLTSDLPSVIADEEELRRVLVNLVNNAVQAIAGTGRVSVRARATPGPHGAPGVALEVEDSGSGIAPEHRTRLFEPYFSTKTAGTGLGLAIVKRIVDDLGGSVSFESQPGRGSLFRVWCPLTPPGA